MAVAEQKVVPAPVPTPAPAPVEEKEASGLRLSLKLKLTLLITTLLVLTVLLVSVFLVRQEQESLTNEMSKRGRTIARDLANASKNPILSNDDLTLSLLVQDAMKDPDVVYVIFADADGKIVAHPDLGQIGQRVERPEGLPMAVGDTQVTPYVDPKHGKVIDFAVPLVFSRVAVGSLYLGFSRKPIDEAVATARNSTIVISAAMVIVGILGALGLATVLSGPVMRLVEGTRAVAAGNFQIHLPGHLPRRDRSVDRVLQPDGEEPPRERDDQAGVHALRRAPGGRRDPEGPREARSQGGAPGRHGALLRHARVHLPGRAPDAGGGRRAC